MAKLCEHHFLLYGVSDSSPACIYTAKAAVQKKQEMILTQLSLTIFKHAHSLTVRRGYLALVVALPVDQMVQYLLVRQLVVSEREREKG